ncbi:TolC family protein [Sphingobacterium oryzagri]|uniref:TolC family protein n=1 Tax=Sphingobacterium oryzagri TaxID=3025669 RepID=A0ABY7WJX7_9SPHI|nr:TolC family protein [Sphingobacterium sp. KACC 22765]WDF69886.1 TolC family protein [Sphingobacterium sp. KACC 22765]
MIRKLSFCIFSLLFLVGGNLSVAYGQISLEQAIKTTLDRNLEVRQAQFGYALSEQTLYQSKSELYPSLSFNANNSYNYGLTFDQTSGQLIRGNDWTSNAGAQFSSSYAVFQGFQRINQIKANKIQLMIDESQVEKVKNDLILSVVTNYLEAITNGELFEAAKQQVKLSREQLRQDSIQFAVGNKTVADIAQAENQVATDELSIMTSENAYEMSLLNLKQLMEMSPDTVFALEKPNIAEIMAEYAILSFEDVFEKALITQPAIGQAGQTKILAQKNIDIARGAYYPTLRFSAGYGTNYSSQARIIGTTIFMPFFDQFNENRSFLGAFNLEVPIFNNNRTKVAVSKAKINYLQAQNDEALLRRNLQKTIAQAILDLKFANKQYFTSQVAFNSSRVAFEAIRERYDVGMANSIEMFTAQTNMNRAEFDMIRRKYEMVFRGKVIDYYIGNPITFNDK